MITPYGRDNAFLMLGIASCLILVAFTPVPMFIGWVTGCVGLVLAAFTFWFFRDSERPLLPQAQADASLVMAPADGQVTEVVALAHHADVGGPATQVSIFLSPLNLHVNRYPASGIITSVRYFPGKYLMAFHPKASEENERSEFVLQTAHGPLVFRQITGFLARRVVYKVSEGAKVSVGTRFGMMKFGSRMDIVLPATASIAVSVGQKVVSAATIIAQLQAERAA
ncbi:MAG: phosphatidylserine decarboxylase family protein [Bradyrhizobiaceae bacterium]|nr:phosphatidylserine decarboxylase family protein [Bradyrhizobiaceae bacterium]